MRSIIHKIHFKFLDDSTTRKKVVKILKYGCCKVRQTMIPFWTNGIVSSLVFLFILHVYVHLHLLNLHNENVMWNRLQSDNKLKFLLSKATSKPEATWIGIISIKLIFSDIMHKKFILERHIFSASFSLPDRISSLTFPFSWIMFLNFQSILLRLSLHGMRTCLYFRRRMNTW